MNKSLFDEMKDAGQGFGALVLGRADAAKYFDLGLRGLAGSFVVFLIASTLNIYLTDLVESAGQGVMEGPAGPSPAQSIFMVAVLFAIQTAFGALALRQFGRLDGLVPYLVADNWVTFFVTGASIALMLMGIKNIASVILIGGIVLLSEINILRLIVKIKPMQIAMFLVAQLVGVLSGLMLLAAVFPGMIAPQ